jgi:MFS transporter, DHA1 family, multidrug resistance protein
LLVLSRSAALIGLVFLNTLCWALAYAVLPFYVHQLASTSLDEGLRWRGWILAVTPLLTILSMPMWIRACRGRNHDNALLLISALQGCCFGLTAAASSLRGIFLSRLLLGFSGPALTLAFMAARSYTAQAASERVAAMQSAITVGLVLGPLVGTTAVEVLGYQATFAFSAMTLVVCGLSPRFSSAPSNDPPAEGQHAGTSSSSVMLLAPMVILVG